LKILEFYFLFPPEHHADDYFSSKLLFYTGTYEFSTNLFDQIYSLMFVKDSKTVILMKKDHQRDAEEEEENKIQGFSKNFIRTWAIGSDLCEDLC
jgi:hypothetical protein